ncbi:MAG TPA: hypothetical protein VF668_12210 [Pyrinomonadaceae bacterium]|jgi:predicted metalloprotease with PDZ domain
MSKGKHGGPPELSYTFKYVRRPGDLRFDVSLRFRGGRTGRTRIILPSEWAGQRELFDAVRLMPPRTRGVVIHDSRSPHRKIVSHRPNQSVTIKYQVRQNWAGGVTDFGQCYRPVLQEDYFHFIGEGFFVHPDRDDERPRLIELNWEGLPDGWALSHSFGAGRRSRIINKSLSQLRRAVYVGGDFRVKKILVRGGRLYVALRGRWNFPDRDFFGLAGKVVEAQRSFWGDDDFPYFLITLIRTSQPLGSFGGTGLTDSFATFASTDEPVGLRLKHLLAHELFHAWNGGKIRPAQPEELLYWFTEGFTEYYTRLLLLRAGLITLEEYFDDYNKAILDYYTSPLREAGNGRILRDYWRDDELRRIPYRRGDILAHNWNARVRVASRGRHSLDDAMTDLFRAAREKGALLSPALVAELLGAYLKCGVRGDIKKHVESGGLIPPHRSALGPVAELKAATVSKFDLGFEFAESGSRKCVGAVREGGPAFRAGLRSGQQILGAQIFYGDPTKVVRLTVMDSRGRKDVQFYPAGEKLRVPQYALPARASEAEMAACRAWFGL